VGGRVSVSASVNDSTFLFRDSLRGRSGIVCVAGNRTRTRTWHKCCSDSSCYCVAMLITIDMRNGIFSFYIRSEETAIRAIALVENDSIRGFNRSHIYSVERLEYSLKRLRKDRNTNWRVEAMAYTRQGISIRGFPARVGMGWSEKTRKAV
jgi:hypothetical protein